MYSPHVGAVGMLALQFLIKQRISQTKFIFYIITRPDMLTTAELLILSVPFWGWGWMCVCCSFCVVYIIKTDTDTLHNILFRLVYYACLKIIKSKVTQCRSISQTYIIQNQDNIIQCTVNGKL